MATTCLNCGTEVTDKFCPHCGQKATVGRLTFHHLLEEAIHFFTHIEKGLPRTTMELLTRPGSMQKNFLDGKRKTYHKPVSFLLIWVATFLLIEGLTKRFGYFDRETTSSFLGVGLEVEAMILKYRALIELLILPFTALNGWIWLCYPKITYLEFLITGFYRFSVFYIFLSVQLILGLIFGFNPNSTVSLYTMAIFFMIWTIYVFYELFKLYQIKFLLPRIILTMLSGSFIYSFLRTMFGKLFLAWGF
ncbi:MAG TPA: DUF3667 domain-containing protein [Chitinophagaceae bacterium]